MGAVLVGGGVIGTLASSVVFRWLQTKGQIDIAISLLYVIFLGSIGLLMLNEAWLSLYAARSGKRRPPRARPNRFVALLPIRWRFYKSGLYISPIAPLLLGFVPGMMPVILGEIGRASCGERVCRYG